VAEPSTSTATARARLREVFSWRTRPGTIITTVLLAVVGFAAAVQIATPEDVLDRASRADLIQILDGLGTRADQLEEEVARLEEARADLLAGAGDSEGGPAEAPPRPPTPAPGPRRGGPIAPVPPSPSLETWRGRSASSGVHRRGSTPRKSRQRRVTLSASALKSSKHRSSTRSRG